MLIFDLDETLIHCNDGPHQSAEVFLSIPWPDGRVLTVNFLFIYVRKEFINFFKGWHKCKTEYFINFADFGTIF